MEFNYCTLFNYNYLSRGLVLYSSLKDTHNAFTLYIFTLDDRAEDYLKSLNLDNCVVIGHKEFEDDKLLKIKPLRSFTEYCWTCTSSVIKYAIEKFNLDSCTYLDADLFFYTSPELIFNEISGSSVGLTPHNYSKEFNKLSVAGKYCVQFVYFKNDEEGMKALGWWREKCLEWCYARIEEGRFGDQKYLDYFDQFKNVSDINTAGSGLAPWNISKFSFDSENGNLIGIDKNGMRFPVIFYHFHKLKIDYQRKIVYLDKYYYDNIAIALVYKPYIEKLISYDNEINGTGFIIENFRIKSPGRIEITIGALLRKIGNNLVIRKIYNYSLSRIKLT